MKPEGVFKRAAGGIVEAVAGLQGRLFAHHAGAAHLLHLAGGVGDLPVAGAQRHRLAAVVFDGDGIGPDEMTLFGLRLAFEILRLDDDLDSAW